MSDLDDSGQSQQSIEEMIQFRVRNPNSVVPHVPPPPPSRPPPSPKQLMMGRNHKVLHSIVEEAPGDGSRSSSCANTPSNSSHHLSNHNKGSSNKPMMDNSCASFAGDEEAGADEAGVMTTTCFTLPEDEEEYEHEEGETTVRESTVSRDPDSIISNSLPAEEDGLVSTGRDSMVSSRDSMVSTRDSLASARGSAVMMIATRESMPKDSMSKERESSLVHSTRDEILNGMDNPDIIIDLVVPCRHPSQPTVIPMPPIIML